jgi:recombination protein RecT
MTNTPAPMAAMRDVRTMLASDVAKKQLGMVAAKHLSPERMTRVVANAARVTPKLYECDPVSLLGAMMTSAALGLEPNNGQGHAFLVPFKNNKKGVTEAQLIIGYKGFIDLAFRSGLLTYIDAGVHYSDDELWAYEKGVNFTLRHAEGPQHGEKLHAYALCQWQNPNGGHGTAAVVLPWAKVMEIRDNSQNWKTAVRYNKTESSPWSTNEDQMAMKTAIRALAQSGRMPMSVEMQTALQVDASPNTDFAAVARGETVMPMPTAEEPHEGQTIDGEAEAEDLAQDEQPQDEAPKQEPKRQTKKADPKPKEEPKPKKEKGDGDADAWKAARQKADMIMADLLDGGPDEYEKILEMHADVVEDLKGNHPEIWRDVQDLMDD